MQHRQIPVACIQTLAHDRDAFETAWPRILALVDEAGRRGAALIVLPEGTVPGYVLGTQSVAPEMLARASYDLATLARRYGATVVCGIAKVIDGKTYNAAIAIGPTGDELGHAAKQFLWHFDRRWFEAGATLEPIETPLGKLGVLVCADGRIPSIAATLCERGAELLVMPTAWVTSGRDPAVLENLQADLMANVRARENAVPFVIANKAGFERASVAYCGKSAIIDASGTFVARGSETLEEIVMGDVSVAPKRALAHDAPALAWEGPGVVRAPSARTRIAFTTATDPGEIARLQASAAEADADLLLSLARLAPLERDRVHDVAGLALAIVGSRSVRHPRALVPTRLAGVDCFAWIVDDADAEWDVRFARTRASELRAYVVVFDAANERAFAVDPDGVILAGTFAGLRLAAFAYDPARAAATIVAPATDVIAGMTTAEAIRAKALREVPLAR